jgi:hypothetical protein
VGLLFKNNAETTLSSGINDAVTTVPVTSAAVFPTPDANNVFFATLDDGTNIETVKVTGISSNDLTVVRAQDNTSAAAFSSGAKIELRLNAKVLEMGTSSLTDLDGDTKIEVEATADSDTIALTSNSGDFSFINSSNTIALIKTTNDNFTIQNNLNDKDFILKGYDSDGGGLITALQIDYSAGGDAIFGGKIQADGALKFNSNTGTPEFQFLGSGTEVGVINLGSSNFNIESKVSDKDIIFKGIDGSSDITALTLDMSDAGRAIFNGSIDIGGGTITRTGDLTLDGSGDLILDAGGEHIRFYDDGNEWGNIESGSLNFNLTATGQDKDFVFLGNDGGSGIIAARIDMSDAGALICNGNITAFGSTSDIRLKENVEVIPNALDKVKQLKGITFNYKKDGKKSTGLIAQDLEKVLPEAVYETSDVDDEDKHLAIRYGNTVGLLVEAIKEQQEQIETLTAKVKELEDK